jgi:enoyl-CoA hydratase/carnithine racemase
VWPFVERLAARIAAFPPHAVAAAKAAVLRAERGVEEDLLAESAAFAGTLGDPSTQTAMARFFELGGQTVEGESRLGSLAGEINAG